MRNKENEVNLVERQGIWFEVNSQEPFTGVAEDFYWNGQLRAKVEMKAGLYDGLVETYFESGQLEQRANFKAGLYDGLFEEYYGDGGVSKISNFKAGVFTETLERNYRVGIIIWKIVKYSLYTLLALFIFLVIYGTIRKADPCAYRNYERDPYTTHGFSSEKELERWRSECLYKD